MKHRRPWFEVALVLLLVALALRAAQQTDALVRKYRIRVPSVARGCYIEVATGALTGGGMEIALSYRSELRGNGVIVYGLRDGGRVVELEHLAGEQAHVAIVSRRPGEPGLLVLAPLVMEADFRALRWSGQRFATTSLGRIPGEGGLVDPVRAADLDGNGSDELAFRAPLSSWMLGVATVTENGVSLLGELGQLRGARDWVVSDTEVRGAVLTVEERPEKGPRPGTTLYLWKPESSRFVRVWSNKDQVSPEDDRTPAPAFARLTGPTLQVLEFRQEPGAADAELLVYDDLEAIVTGGTPSLAVLKTYVDSTGNQVPLDDVEFHGDVADPWGLGQDSLVVGSVGVCRLLAYRNGRLEATWRHAAPWYLLSLVGDADRDGRDDLIFVDHERGSVEIYGTR